MRNSASRMARRVARRSIAVWLTALLCAVAVAAALAIALVARPAAAGGSTPSQIEQDRLSQENSHSRGKRQERFLYVATIAQSATDPDFVAVIGADPRRSDFGKNRQPYRHAQRGR